MTAGLREDQLERVISAVETIESSLDILTRKRSVRRQTYKQDRETRDIVERRFVKMTEAAIDIGQVLLVHETGAPGESTAETMRRLTEADILTDETADALAAAARFRNVLAHTYGPIIDHDTVYDALQDLERYRTFLHEVHEFLDSTGAFNE